MKRITSLLLLIALTLTLGTMLASCDMITGGDNNSGDESYGYFVKDGKGYFVIPDGVIEINAGAAKVISAAPEGTPESKKFNAPDTFDAEFETEASGSGVAITGVSGSNIVMVPKTIDGKTVTSVKNGAFDGVKAVIFATPDSAIQLDNGAFKGVGNVYIATTGDNLLVAQQNFLTDSANVKINVTADEISNLKSHYNWMAYADSLKKF